MIKFHRSPSLSILLTILISFYACSSTAHPQDPKGLNTATESSDQASETSSMDALSLDTATPSASNTAVEQPVEQPSILDQMPLPAIDPTTRDTPSLGTPTPSASNTAVEQPIEQPSALDQIPLPADEVTTATLNSEQTIAQDSEVVDESAPVQSEAETQIAEPEKQTLELLGRNFEPSQAAVLNWEFEATFVDASAQVPVLVVNGAEPGPTLCLTAAVHGDELNGIEVVRRVVHSVDPAKLSGALIGVPIVNLQGFQRANRYLPDRRDLNRYFPGRVKGSYASRIAHSFFTQVIQQCDFLVDIHTGSLSRTNLPQIRANLLDPEIAALAEKMGSIVVLQSKGGSGTLRRAAAEYGIPSVTLEAGAPNNLQKEAVESGVKSVLNAMDSLGMTAPSPQPFWKRSEEPIFYQSTWIRARRGGILFSKVELGDTVRKGNVLGLLSDPITNKTTKIIAPFDGRVIGMALNQVMYQGFAAYHIGLKSSMVEAAQPPELIVEDSAADISTEQQPTASSMEEPLPIDVDTAVDNEHDEGSSVDTLLNPIEDMELPTADEDD